MSRTGPPEKLLIVDDDPGILRGLRWSLDGYELLTAADRAAAIKQLRQHRPKVVTLDLGLPPAVDDASEGLAALDEILKIDPTTKVIVVSGNEDRANAVAAVGRGAADFYSKPIDAEVLGLIVARAFHLHALEEENRRLRAQTGATFEGLITTSPAMAEVCRTVEKIAPAEINVLLNGESGTGKELLARAVHSLSGRKNGPFNAINCAAIPENLLESELFGHEKGAFTGATRQVKGKVELTDSGTLFLDEIGDMPEMLQGKLLRFLQERVIERIGGRDTIPVDVRVVCATHRDLPQMISEGGFREDLYYRLAQITVTIPPLRARGDDAVVLAKRFAERFAVEQKRKAPRLSNEAAAVIRRHPWRGNVRELENTLRRAVILDADGEIGPDDLGLPADGPTAQAAVPAPVTSLRVARERAERQAVEAALKESGGNLSAAARILEVSRPTLYNLVKQHDLATSE